MRRLRCWSEQGLIVLFLLVLAGCAVEHGKVYVKDGKRYGEISRQTWRDRWWDYYERGVSYAAGEFWDESMADFQAAIAQREADQRRARTYGMHLIDYFPHRELGIIQYRRGRHTDAIRELKTSLASEASAKAKFYLNKARKGLLQRTGSDVAPPRIVLDGPQDGLLTNRFRVMVRGRVEDDTYVATIAVNGEAQFIELAEPSLPFTGEVALRDGTNIIDIVAGDLIGRHSRKRLTIHLDRHSPLVSLYGVDVIDAPTSRLARVSGWLFDHSRITRFVVAGRQVPLQSGTEWEFRLDVPITPEMTFLPFEVEDAAGNVTRGEITLGSPEDGSSDIRDGRLYLPLWPRWARHLPEVGADLVVSDVPMPPAILPRHTAWRDAQAPVIRLTGVKDRDIVYDNTLYVEGRITDASAIVAFSINGESLWRRQTRQLFFGQAIPLAVGENVLRLEALDAAGNRAERTLVIIREVRKIRRVGSRLRVVLLPFEKRGDGSVLSEVAHDYLFNVFVKQRRFDIVERQRLDAILHEHKLSRKSLADPATVVRTGKLATAEGILAGMVTESPHSLEVFARFVDVESAVVLAAEDVYGEDLTPRTMKTLMEGLAWKFQQRFPMVEGFVIDRQGKRVTIDLAEGQGIKRYMKLIVFRVGKTLQHPRTGRILRKPDTILGEARIVAVTEDLSEAVLLSSQALKQVQGSDHVITK